MRNIVNPAPLVESEKKLENFRIHEDDFLVRQRAHEFPLMIILSMIYPCNFGCPNCPYSDGNSEIRKFYRDRHGDLFSVELWRKIADECGTYGAWMRCTGGGE